jgi:sulfide:quinone oxidoreductase
VTFPLEQIYKKEGIVYHQAKAISIHPEGDANLSSPFVTIEYTKQGIEGTTEKLTYDYLINATGPNSNLKQPRGWVPITTAFLYAPQVMQLKLLRHLMKLLKQ